MKALSADNYEKAAEHFKQAAADKPDDMWAFYYVGLCLLKLKRYDEATNAYQQAISLKPGSAEVHYQLGKIQVEKGDIEAAKKEYRWLREHDRELALYLLDLFPIDDLIAQLKQEHPDQPAIRPYPQSEDGNILKMTADLRPTILYREKAKYAEIARINYVQGTVVIQVVFDRNGSLRDFRVIRGLPDGLTHKAIEAAQKIRFNPATKNGGAVSVRGSLEYTFNLY
jgi:TonB family protein